MWTRLERVHRRAADLGPAAPARRERSPRPCGFRCTARAAGPTTSARRRRSTTPTAASRCGATRGRPSCTARCATRWAISRLQHFWGPMANIKSSAWIADSAVHAAQAHQPDFFYIYLPHLDYAAQKHGPDSDGAGARRGRAGRGAGPIGRRALQQAYGDAEPLWLVASEYAIVPGRSRPVSQPRAARGGAAWPCATSRR